VRVYDLERKLVRRRVVGFGSRALLIARFDLMAPEFERSFGNHAKQLHETLYEARSLGAALYVVWSRSFPNQAINRLSSPDVRIVQTSSIRDKLVVALWVVTTPTGTAVRGVRRVARGLRGKLKPLNKHVGRTAKKSSGILAARAAAFVRRLDSALAAIGPPLVGADEVRLEMARNPIRVALPEELERAGRAEAERAGLDPDVGIVTLHVREKGWSVPSRGRSADIETYGDAVAHLVGRGFRVVRIGDSGMAPVDWEGAFDLATSHIRTDLLELWCMLHSVFFLGCDSGPTEVAKLIGIPTLLVNVKRPVQQYPLRASDLYIVKRIDPTDSPYAPSLREQIALITAQYEGSEEIRYRGLLDNTSEEIHAAVEEMLAELERPSPETEAQAEFRRLASAKVKSDGLVRHVFRGDGRIARCFADRYFDDSSRREQQTARR
jgi:putative glycosyltransferase (TIGR04372 family)